MIINLDDEEVSLDESKFAFSEATLSNYLQTEAGWYDYFGAKLAKAEFIYQRKEMEYESLYGEKFKTFKEDGATEKKAEACCKSDNELKAAKLVVLEAKFNVRLIQQHLRAWDKNHENAQSRGHFLRKEMDKLHRDVIKEYSDPVEEIVKNLED